MQDLKQIKHVATLSLYSIALTVALASITHSFQFGFRAFVAGGIIATILIILNRLYQRNKNTMLFIFYALLNAWVIIGFGIINGFWNHTFKVFLNYLHNGYLPPFLAGLFSDPKVGSFLLESTGIATFVTSMVAAYYIFQMAPKKHTNGELN